MAKKAPALSAISHPEGGAAKSDGGTAGGRLIVKGEANLNRDLPMADLAILKVPPRLNNLKPTHVSHCFRGAGDGILNRLVAAGGRRTHEGNYFINMVAHVFVLFF
jgi:hypothetical protein